MHPEFDARVTLILNDGRVVTYELRQDEALEVHAHVQTLVTRRPMIAVGQDEVGPARSISRRPIRDDPQA